MSRVPGALKTLWEKLTVCVRMAVKALGDMRNSRPRPFIISLLLLSTELSEILAPAGDFRRFEIKQKKLIREIQKIPTVFQA